MRRAIVRPNGLSRQPVFVGVWREVRNEHIGSWKPPQRLTSRGSQLTGGSCTRHVQIKASHNEEHHDHNIPHRTSVHDRTLELCAGRTIRLARWPDNPRGWRSGDCTSLSVKCVRFSSCASWLSLTNDEVTVWWPNQDTPVARLKGQWQGTILPFPEPLSEQHDPS